jgi:hypothetical protein
MPRTVPPVIATLLLSGRPDREGLPDRGLGNARPTYERVGPGRERRVVRLEQLSRYPALDPASFRRAVEETLGR